MGRGVMQGTLGSRVPEAIIGHSLGGKTTLELLQQIKSGTAGIEPPDQVTCYSLFVGALTLRSHWTAAQSRNMPALLRDQRVGLSVRRPGTHGKLQHLSRARLEGVTLHKACPGAGLGPGL